MTERVEVHLAHGFVLHHRPFRNTSQLLECLTIDSGRTALIAQGSRRPNTPQRALLQPFRPLRLSWVRRGELGRLTHVEADARQCEFGGEHLLAAYYVNELVLRLLARDDPNPEAYACYRECIDRLAAALDVARTLRLFELSLLSALGYGLALSCETESGEPLDPDRRYFYELENGPKLADERAAESAIYWGRELIALRNGELSDRSSLMAAKRLLGRALLTYLGDKPLKSRAVFEDILARGCKR